MGNIVKKFPDPFGCCRKDSLEILHTINRISLCMCSVCGRGWFIDKSGKMFQMVEEEDV